MWRSELCFHSHGASQLTLSSLEDVDQNRPRRGASCTSPHSLFQPRREATPRPRTPAVALSRSNNLALPATFAVDVPTLPPTCTTNCTLFDLRPSIDKIRTDADDRQVSNGRWSKFSFSAHCSHCHCLRRPAVDLIHSACTNDKRRGVGPLS